MTSERRLAAAILCAIALFTLSACGGGGGGDSTPQQPPADTTMPTVSNVSLPDGTTVNRTVSLSVTASDNVGVTDVRFYADGNLLGNELPVFEFGTQLFHQRRIIAGDPDPRSR